MSIVFRYDPERASHATRWLLARHGGRLDRLKLIKLIFLADRLHLARYGRPIVGGRYVAMEHGPVASDFYNAIKGDTLEGTKQDGVRVECAVRPDEDFLSETDLEVLREVNDQYGSFDTFRLRDMTHLLRAWGKNYKGENSSYPLPYEDFFEDLADEKQRALGLISEGQEAERVLG
jgi:uncharacterized phage-associated protein